MTTAYINRDGAKITAEDWKTRSADNDYCLIKRYDNGIISVQLWWVGKVVNIENTFPDMWKVFRLSVRNYNDQGDAVSDPVMDGKWFATKESGIVAYEVFLKHWTKCHADEEGKFVEEDSVFYVPPPPSLDAPTTDIFTVKGLANDGVGAW